ncbi:MAG: Hpt domain-containing protein, partial [Betaproteobacteria bacterium]|nr:Hpt domain-containing protein [Betaproteobacteria bacterium]
MVGLKDLGETAWAMEQVLNLWLRQEYEVGPELFALIEHAHTVFSAWVDFLETREGSIPDPTSLVAEAERLRGVESATPAEAPAPVEVPPPLSPLVDLATLGGPVVEVDLPVPGILDIDFSAPESEPERLEGAQPSPLSVPASSDLEFASEALPSLDIELEAVPGLESAHEAVPAPEPTPELEALPPLELGQWSDEVISLDVMPEEPATEVVVLDILDVPASEQPAVEESIELPPLLETEAEPSFEIELPPVNEPEAPLELGQLPEAVVALEPMPEEPSAEGVVLDILEIPPSEAPASEESIELPSLAEAETAELPEPEPLSAPVPSSSKFTLAISPTLYQIFLEEAKTHLATLQRQFGLLETEPDMPTPEPLTRAAHTLGGIAGTIGLTPINRLGLALEHAVLRRDQAVKPNSLEALETIRLVIACLEEMVASVAAERLPEAAPHLVEALENLYPSAATATSFATEEVPAVLSAATLAKMAPPPEPPRQLKDELDEQLLPIFLEEAQELTQTITEQLRAWREDPADSEVARSLARLFHTLKGSARMAGAMNLGELTHALETRVEHAHKSGGVNVVFVEELQTAFDAISQIVERLARGETLDTPVPVEVLGLSEAPEAAPQPPAPEATAAPAVPQGPPVPFVERRRAKAAEAEAEPDVTGAARATLRVRADLMDRLVNEAGELSIARARIEGEMRSLKESLLDLTENVIRLRRQLREVEIQAETQIQARTAEAEERHAGFDPLEFDRFTHFQELTRMMAESVNDVATVQQNLLKNLDEANAAIVAQARLNRELQQELMSVRMVPFSSQAERLYRIVRQTAKEMDKRANLDIAGGQVELDRGLLDKMVAPLEHMLRNSVAHGLESREGRLTAGKPEIGEINLTVAQEGNEVIITLADDGTGLDLERIRAKAIAKGLLVESEEADAARLAEFIFTPGFSTA